MVTNKLIWLRHQLNKLLVGTVLPIGWFGPKPPATTELQRAGLPVHLEIVSHSWRYAHMLNFQLSSLVNYPPTQLQLTYTLYHASEDTDLKKLISRYNTMQVPNVTWNWIEVPKEQLFRRAIGRNRTALASTADWLWFSDCDLIFHDACLDSLALQLNGCQERMVFPQQEYVTELLDPSHPMLNQSTEANADIDTALFETNAIHKAKGAFQIVHGDVARMCGYCRDIKLYQQPMQHWSKTYEDSMFRRLINSEGMPVNVQGLYRIRHIEKGRYTKGSQLSRVRKSIRVVTDDQGSQH